MRGSSPIRMAAAAFALVACAPSAGSSGAGPVVAVSPAGAVLVASAGRAFAARPPAFDLVPLPAPAAVAGVAWHEGDPWLAMPAAGLVARAGGVPGSLSLPGRPVRLSSTRIFLEDGSVVAYDGTPAGRLPEPPTAILEGGSRSWALAGGIVYELTAVPRAIERAPAGATALRIDGSRVEALDGPLAVSGGTTVRVEDGRLVARDLLGASRGEAALPTGPVALAAGGAIVAAGIPGRLLVFSLPGLALLADRRLPMPGPRQ